MNEKLYSLRALTDKYCAYKIYSHQNRVVQFSDILFKHFSPLMDLDEEDKEILILAAQVHDIGKLKDKKLHHKYSMDIILNYSDIKDSIGDINEAVAVLAYSHRHVLFQDINCLEYKMKNKFLQLISILRVADALDYYEKDNIKVLDVHVNNEFVLIYVNKNFNKESIVNFDKKKELFEEITNLKLLLVSK